MVNVNKENVKQVFEERYGEDSVLNVAVDDGKEGHVEVVLEYHVDFINDKIPIPFKLDEEDYEEDKLRFTAKKKKAFQYY